MYLNGFSVIISQGLEIGNGYIEIKHGTQYTISLYNSNSVRADAEIYVDGKHIGTFRVNAYSNISLERPLNDNGKFTFYRSGSIEFNNSELYNVSRSKLGLIQVTFKPEKAKITLRSKGISGQSVDSHSLNCYSSNTNWSSGGTGLSGYSSQEFVNVSELDYDKTTTTINLRLIERNRKSVRPLKSNISTPIPEPI
jgi:hypothetical protein